MSNRNKQFYCSHEHASRYSRDIKTLNKESVFARPRQRWPVAVISGPYAGGPRTLMNIHTAHTFTRKHAFIGPANGRTFICRCNQLAVNDLELSLCDQGCLSVTFRDNYCVNFHCLSYLTSIYSCKAIVKRNLIIFELFTF